MITVAVGAGSTRPGIAGPPDGASAGASAGAGALDEARALARAGEHRRAAEAYEQVAARFPKTPIASRALASAGALWQWDLDEPARARVLYDRVLAGPLDAPGAMPALIQRLELERDTGGARGELVLVRALLSRGPSVEVAAPYLLGRAAVLLEELGELEAAVLGLAELRRRFPRSTRADDAAMHEAALLRRLGRPREAIALYRAVIATGDDSFIVGEYNSTRLDDAYFELAETYRRELAEVARAIDAYLRLVDEVPLSRRVDDALHQAAALAAARGDTELAASLRARLVALRPHSRFARSRP